MASIQDKNKGKKGKRNYYVVTAKHKWIHVGPDLVMAKALKAQLDRDELDLPGEIGKAQALVPEFNAAADAWIESRKAPDKHGEPRRRSWGDDQSRMKIHLRPAFQGKRLDQITEDDVRRLIEKLRATHEPQTIRNVLHTLSRLYEDQPKRMRLFNPVRALTKADREDVGAGWDPKKTAYLKKKEDVERLLLAFPEMSATKPFRVIYAVGVLAGLRTGEARALHWEDIDHEWRNIHVQRSDRGPLKDDESRFVPVPPALAYLLKQWRTFVCSIGEKRCFVPSAGGRQATPGKLRYIKDRTMNAAHKEALKAAGLPTDLTVYQTTRHTFGAQWVMNGGSLHKLAAVLGHSSTIVTQRYAHLEPGNFSDQERSLVDINVGTKLAPVVALQPEVARGQA